MYLVWVFSLILKLFPGYEANSELLVDAWRITFKHKVLWVMGFLVSLAGMGVSLFGGGGSGSRRPGTTSIPRSTPPPIVELWERLSDRPELQGMLIAVLCVAMLAVFIALLLSVIGRGGLVGGIELAREKGSVTFGEAWAAGMQYFWRILGARLLFYLPVAVGGLFIFCLGAASVFLPFMFLCLLPLLGALAFIMLVVSVVAALAERGIVVDDMTPLDAYRQGWSLMRGNLGRTVALSIVLYFAKFIFGFAVVALLGVAFLPAIAALDPESPNLLLLGASALLFACIFPIMAPFASIVTTWDFAAWNLIYRQFAGYRPAAVTST